MLFFDGKGEDQALHENIVARPAGASKRFSPVTALTRRPSAPRSRVNAPLIEELPVALECKVKSFEDGILVGEIVNVTAEESVVTDGKIDIKKLKPISYNPADNTYVALGDVVGKAFSDGLAFK